MKTKIAVISLTVSALISVILLFVSDAGLARSEVIQGFSITVDEDSKVSLFEDLKVDKGQRYHSVVVIGGDLDFSGEADDVVVMMGDARLEAGSKVDDDLVVLLGNSFMADGAYVGGETVNVDGLNVVKKFFKYVLVPGALITALAIPPLLFLIKIILFGVAFGLALLLFHVFPEITARSKELIKSKMLASFLWGLLGLLLIVPILLFFTLSIVGIPLIPLYAIFLFLVILGGFAVSGHYVGNAIPAKIFKESETLSLLTGMLIICLVGLIPVVGLILKWLAVTIGLGAVSVALFEKLGRKKTSD